MKLHAAAALRPGVALTYAAPVRPPERRERNGVVRAASAPRVMKPHPVVAFCPGAAVQRKLRIGCNRAARLPELMEQQGAFSAMESNGAREALAPLPPES